MKSGSMKGKMMTDNMEIWNAVSLTDPSHTKHVGQRGGFTAIDAQYQIMMATEQFGPLGIGWGYDVGAPLFTETLILVPVTLWHGDRQNTFGPQYGCAVIQGQRPDADAPKKATTDAITKLLSHLGFNADVFLGKFDDSKYVEKAKQEVKKKREALAGPFTSKTALWGAVREFDREIRGCGDSDMLEAFLAMKESVALLEQLERDAPQLLNKDDSTPAEFEAIQDLIERKRDEFNAEQRAAA